MAKLDSIDSLPKEEKIEYLGTLAGMSWEPMDQEQSEVFVRAQGMLLAIPGHAEYFAEKLNNDREVLDNFRNSHPGSSGPYLSTLVTDQMYAFKTLGSLPSVETVRVLGEFLDDERGKRSSEKVYNPDNDGGEGPNAEKAARALTRLPIVPKPTTLQWDRIFENDIEGVTQAWKLWYQQVKAGNRTFRFEGDDTEYSLNGSVNRLGVAQAVAKSQPAALAAPAPPGHKSSIVFYVLPLVLLVLFVAAWKALRGKRE